NLGNSCRSEGKPRGDTARADENRRMLAVFLRLAQGSTLKQVAIDIVGGKHFEKQQRSLSVLTKRFSRRVYSAVCSRYGGVSKNFLQHDIAARYLSSLFGSIEKWPGVRSNSRDDGYALCEALRHYKPTQGELRQMKKPRGYLVQVGPSPNF